MDRLRAILQRIDGRGYKAYKELQGVYQFPDYTLSIDHVQSDPFAHPSRVSIKVAAQRAQIPTDLWCPRVRQTALEDYLARRIARAIEDLVKGARGIGNSGEVAIACGGQQVLPRNAVLMSAKGVEARITVGMPAHGRAVRSAEAAAIFFDELPRVIAASLFYEHLPEGGARAHVLAVENQAYLRDWLDENKLVAFVADGSVLPRQSGVDDRPLQHGALAFRAPEAFAHSPCLPNGGPLRGMGIPQGVTLIVGGGFHGKSTLLHALERGVYDHIPGDGRERVVTDATAVKVRAEDGRAVSGVNISPFIDNLPFGRDTVRFSSANASGSTSQATNIIEALECGARLLLIDEDTSATNFMIRDERMQALVAADKEPITPFLHRVRELYERHGVSTIVVMGGSGDYFEVSDTVIMMDAYEPKDVTAKAQRIASPPRVPAGIGRGRPLASGAPRTPAVACLDPSSGRRPVKINATGTHGLTYGKAQIDLSKVEQLVDIGQTRAIGLLIHYYARHYAGRPEGLNEGLTRALHDVHECGLDVLLPYKAGNLALPRLHELAAAINRLRGLELVQYAG